MIENRIKKNFKKLKSMIKEQNLEAYRLYDRDIPEYPFIVDRYGQYFVFYFKGDTENEKDNVHFSELEESVKSIFSLEKDQIIVKRRRVHDGRHQYSKLDDKNSYVPVQEGKFKFLVNLWDYLDTGLFLDHRFLRKRIFKEASEKTFLNLFSYTSSVSVAAALGGAITTSVDMSSTYIKWSKQNFELNGISENKHIFRVEDVLESIRQNKFGKYDIIYCDPPTFSNSKKMKKHFDVSDDHIWLIHSMMERLNAKGKLYFSTNKRKFKLGQDIIEKYSIVDLSQKSIPSDFHDQNIHKCFEIFRN